jgi:hypothetical protein
MALPFRRGLAAALASGAVGVALTLGACQQSPSQSLMKGPTLTDVLVDDDNRACIATEVPLLAPEQTTAARASAAQAAAVKCTCVADLMRSRFSVEDKVDLLNIEIGERSNIEVPEMRNPALAAEIERAKRDALAECDVVLN